MVVPSGVKRAFEMVAHLAELLVVEWALLKVVQKDF